MAKVPFYIQGQDKSLYDSDLNAVLQQTLSDNGLPSPQQSSANITSLGAQAPNGVIWYDTDNHRYVGKENGVLVAFTTAPI